MCASGTSASSLGTDRTSGGTGARAARPGCAPGEPARLLDHPVRVKATDGVEPAVLQLLVPELSLEGQATTRWFAAAALWL